MKRMDKYGNSLRTGYRVVDLRWDGDGRKGIVIGVTEKGILVKWDGNEDDSLVDGNEIVLAERSFR